MKLSFFLSIFCVTFICVCQTAPSFTAIAQQNSETSKAAPDIETLLQALESPRYQERQAAMEQVIATGSGDLQIIARYYFEAPPESVYRIRKILEGISSNGDEATFVKATSLLLALYSNGSDEMRERIEGLKEDWRLRRRNAALEVIMAAGATVKPVSFNARQVQVRALNRRVERGKEPVKTAEPTKRPALSVKEQMELVETILSNSTSENREFIFKSAPEAPVTAGDYVIQSRTTNQQRLAIEFPVGWPVEEAVLERLRQVESPIALTLQRTPLTQQDWNILKENPNIFSMKLDEVPLPAKAADALPEGLQSLSLQSYSLVTSFCESLEELRSLSDLQLSNCEFSASSVNALNKLRRVAVIPISFESHAIDRSTVDALAKLAKFRNLTLKDVKFTAGAVELLEQLNQVNTIQLKSMTAGANLLESIGRMKSLTLLDMRGCKFDIPAFKEIASSRRRTQFAPKAFLGVGPMTNVPQGRASCQIAFVSPNSAASEGGIQVGDTLLAIDGHPVETFEEVRMEIAQFDPGDPMKIKLSRNNRVTEIEVELGTNPQAQN